MSEIVLKRTSPHDHRLHYAPNDPVSVHENGPYPRSVDKQWLILQVLDRKREELQCLCITHETDQPVEKVFPIHQYNSSKSIAELQAFTGYPIKSTPEVLRTEDRFIQIAVQKDTDVEAMTLSSAKAKEAKALFVEAPKVTETEKAKILEGVARFVSTRFNTPRVYNKRRYNIDISKLPVKVLDVLVADGIVQCVWKDVEPCIVDRTASQ